MTHLRGGRCFFPPFVMFPRGAALRLADDGLAKLLHLRRAAVRPPLVHLAVSRGRGRRPGQELAEGDFSQETLLRLPGKLRQQHQFFTSAETMEQEADQGLEHHCLYHFGCEGKKRATH